MILPNLLTTLVDFMPELSGEGLSHAFIGCSQMPSKSETVIQLLVDACIRNERGLRDAFSKPFIRILQHCAEMSIIDSSLLDGISVIH